MKNKIFKRLFFLTILITVSSCTTLNHTMREPNTRVHLNKSDFTLSGQVTAEAKTVKVLGIDWRRFFIQKTGEVKTGSSSISLVSVPVIGNVIMDKTANYSLYELMIGNPGYDVVFYPQYETRIFKPVLGIGFFTKITTVKTTARLGKLTE